MIRFLSCLISFHAPVRRYFVLDSGLRDELVCRDAVCDTPRCAPPLCGEPLLLPPFSAGVLVPASSDCSSWNAGACKSSQSPPSFQGPRTSGSPRSPTPVESLKYCDTSSGVGGIRPIENAGFP